jgi:hypothetical protein
MSTQNILVLKQVHFFYSLSCTWDWEGRTMLAGNLLKPQCSQYYPITLR